jgi:hypothetical protein
MPVVTAAADPAAALDNLPTHSSMQGTNASNRPKARCTLGLLPPSHVPHTLLLLLLGSCCCSLWRVLPAAACLAEPVAFTLLG